MKKSLFAIAAVTAFAGAAQAQSSVTVYGILDVGFAGTSSRGAQAAVDAGKPATATSALANTSTAGINSSQQTTSRLGFRGNEDLGGGTSAFFTVEFNLAPTGPDLLTSGGQAVLNRQTFVGIGQKGIGNTSIGTQYTPIFNLLAATDPGQTNNGVGSVIYPQGGSGITSNALVVRQNNAIRFETERMSGVQLIGYFSQANTDARQTAAANSTTTAGGTTNNNGYGLNANVQIQKLYAGVAYQSFKNETDGTANATFGTGVILPTTGASVASNGTNITDTGMFAGAVYDFGIVKAYANYVSRKITSVLDSNQYVKRSAQQLGVRGNVTPKIEAFATIGNGSYKAFGAGEPTANFTGYQLGTNYYLSKRTNLYGMYGATNSSNVTTVSGVQVSSGASQYAVGVRHTF